VESCQWPAPLKLSARASTRRSFKQGDSAHAGCRASLTQGLEQPGGELASTVSKTGTNAPGLSFNRKFAAFRFAVLRRPQSLRSRSHKTYCQPNSQSQTASHGSVESRQWPARLKLSARALTRRSFKQRDSALRTRKPRQSERFGQVHLILGCPHS
jgi:hypothetical protein